MARMILASASPRRTELLREIVPDFEVIPSRAEELHDASLDPAHLCELNAERKAREVAERCPERLVVGADTLVALNGEIFGKPASLDEARRMLSALSGKRHRVVTGVALLHLESGREEVFSVETEVTFRSLTPELIEEYIGKVQVLDKAGAYAIQEQGEMIVAGIQGSWSNVVGLPLEKLGEVLERWGIR